MFFGWLLLQIYLYQMTTDDLQPERKKVPLELHLIMTKLIPKWLPKIPNDPNGSSSRILYHCSITSSIISPIYSPKNTGFTNLLNSIIAQFIETDSYFLVLLFVCLFFSIRSQSLESVEDRNKNIALVLSFKQWNSSRKAF